ncbi:hypothetical protein H4S14_002924 [Agrobacterium vitis]|nr:hypothetical protein [Agrobacterium vitis]MBE1439162.1 hypothetical protein [Agrobacterium vitis]
MVNEDPYAVNVIVPNCDRKLNPLVRYCDSD